MACWLEDFRPDVGSSAKRKGIQSKRSEVQIPAANFIWLVYRSSGTPPEWDAQQGNQQPPNFEKELSRDPHEADIPEYPGINPKNQAHYFTTLHSESGVCITSIGTFYLLHGSVWAPPILDATITVVLTQCITQ